LKTFSLLLLACCSVFFLRFSYTTADLAYPDPRIANLERFFNKHNCPKPTYADDYISSADKYNLPYALLPAISIAESQCGRRQRLSNWWGWNSAKTGFTSVGEGIAFVSSKLANGRYYAGKTLEQKILTYNSANPNHLKIIKSLMAQIEQTK
jgi:hypothetical protein